MDIPVILKDKENKTVIVIENFVCIDNRESKPMLFLNISNIWKIQGILDSNNNQFHINIYVKSYIISTFSKVLIAKDLLKKTEIIKILDSDKLKIQDFNSSSSKELKKIINYINYENIKNQIKKFEKSLFSIQLNLKIIKYYNNLFE